MPTPRNAGYAVVGEITQDLANALGALYWSLLDPPPVFSLPVSVALPGGAVGFTATLAIEAPQVSFARDPGRRVGVSIAVTGAVQAVYQNSVLQLAGVQLTAAGHVAVSVDTSTSTFIPTLDLPTATLDTMSLTPLAGTNIPAAVTAALTSPTVIAALQSVLQAQKPLKIGAGLVPDRWSEFGVELAVVNVAVVPLPGILAVAADLAGYTTGDPSQLVDLFTTPSPQGAQRLINQRGGDTELPGGELVTHKGNVAVTVNGDMLLRFLNGPAAEKLKELVWEKDWGGPAALPGPLLSTAFHCQRVALGHQGSLRQLDCLGVGADGLLRVLWVLDQGEWQGDVAVSEKTFPSGAPIALANQQSLDQLTALVIDSSGTLNLTWEQGTGRWQKPITLGTPGGFVAGGAIAMANQGSLDQLTALTFDGTGTLNVLWVRDSGTWQGPVPVGPAIFPAGGCIAVGTQGSQGQLTALAVDNSGTVNVFWVVGEGAWQGPVPIPGTQGRFPHGAPIALANQGSVDQLTAVVVDNDGTVNVLRVEGGGAWQGPLPIASTSRMAKSGASVVMANQGSLGQLTAVTLDAHGTLQVLWVIGTGEWQGPLAISPIGFTDPLAPLAIAQQGSADQLTVLVADNNQAVNALWVIGSGRWQGPVPLRVQGRLHSSRAAFGYQATDPTAMVSQLDALAVDDSGTLFVLWVQGTAWWHDPIAITPSGFAPPGAPIAVAPQGSAGELTALVVGSHGALNVLWVTGTGPWQGPIGISRDGFAQPGSAIALGQQGSGDQLTALVIDAFGTLNVFWVIGSASWQGPVPIGRQGAFAPGAPIALANQGSMDQLTALTVDRDGIVQLLWVRDGGSWQGPVALTRAGFAPAGASIAMANQGSLDLLTAVVVDSFGAVQVLWVVGTGNWQGPVPITPQGFAPAGAGVALQYQPSRKQLSAFVVDGTGVPNVLWVIDDDDWKGPVPLPAGSNFAAAGAPVSVALQNPGTSDEFLDVFVQNAAGELTEFWIQDYGLTRDGFSVVVSDVSFRFGSFNIPLHPTAWPGIIVEVTATSSGFSGTITMGFDVRLDALGDGDTAWLNREKNIQNWNFAADYVDISAGWQDYVIALVAGAVLTVINPGLISFVSLAFVTLFDGIVPSLLVGFDAQAQKAINSGLASAAGFGTAWPYVQPAELPGASTSMSVTSYDCVISPDGLDYFAAIA